MPGSRYNSPSPTLELTSNDCEVNKMAKPRMHIGAESPDKGFDRFLDAWQRAERGEKVDTEVHLNYQDLSMLGTGLLQKG